MDEKDGNETGLQFSIRTYKFFGMVFYYRAIGLFWLLDRHYKTDGIITKVGYCYGVAFLMAAFIASTGEQRIADIQAELNGGPDDTLVDKAWAIVDQVVYWGSVLSAIYFLYYYRIWDAAASLGFPAWKLWLKLEVRRLKIRSGEIRPSILWKAAFACCAAFTLIMLALMFFTGYGPYKDLGWGEFQTYPAFFIAGIVCTMLSLIGAGAKLD